MTFVFTRTLSPTNGLSMLMCIREKSSYRADFQCGWKQGSNNVIQTCALTQLCFFRLAAFFIFLSGVARWH